MILHATLLLAVLLAATPTLVVATTIAQLLAAVASPFVLRYIHADGLTMSAVSYVVALLVAIAAALLTGELTLTPASLLAILGGSTGIWTVQQAVYAVFRQVLPTAVGARPPRPSP